MKKSRSTRLLCFKMLCFAYALGLYPTPPSLCDGCVSLISFNKGLVSSQHSDILFSKNFTFTWAPHLKLVAQQISTNWLHSGKFRLNWCRFCLTFTTLKTRKWMVTHIGKVQCLALGIYKTSCSVSSSNDVHPFKVTCFIFIRDPEGYDRY